MARNCDLVFFTIWLWSKARKRGFEECRMWGLNTCFTITQNVHSNNINFVVVGDKTDRIKTLFFGFTNHMTNTRSKLPTGTSFGEKMGHRYLEPCVKATKKKTQK